MTALVATIAQELDAARQQLAYAREVADGIARRVEVLERVAAAAAELDEQTEAVKDPGPAPTAATPAQRRKARPRPTRGPSAPPAPVALTGAADEALAVILAAGAEGTTTAAIALATRRNAQYVSTILTKLEAAGRIVRVGVGKARRVYAAEHAPPRDGETRPKTPPSTARRPATLPVLEAIADAANDRPVKLAPDVLRDLVKRVVDTLNQVTEPVTARHVANHVGRAYEDVERVLVALEAKGAVVGTKIDGVDHYARRAAA